MFNTRRPLVFNWKYGDKIIRESFGRSSYNLSEEDYEICDYIFQMHSVLCLYRMEQLEHANINPTINEYFLKNITLDDSFSTAVHCLKSTYATILQCGKILNHTLNGKTNGVNEADIKEHLHSMLLNVDELPNANFYLGIKQSLVECLATSERNPNKESLANLEELLKKVRKDIQNKADEIVEEMEQSFKNDVSLDLEAFLENLGNSLQLDAVSKKMETFNGCNDKVLQNLRSLIYGYDRYVSENGCFALCIIDGKKYFSLSGISDYVGSLSLNGLPNKRKMTKLKGLWSFLNNGSTFTYAPLSDSVMCYGFYDIKTYLLKPEKLPIFLPKRTPFKPRDISCCERKIMALQRNGKDYKFYIRFEPCFLCLPDLLPEDNKKIVSFVPSNSGCKMLTVRAVLKAPFYELI